ncbi:MAG: mechanosensitive ion channel family protein [Methanomicrobiales archaeon]|nr:mechanosensitive ion channel family protein [Methanomicrobiales archaeon]MDI6875177.1 mechanosensitive ion channel family protein [Methanomicrobiales archaeon]
MNETDIVPVPNDLVIEVLFALLIVLGSIVLTRALFFFIKRYLSRFTVWTETSLDDELLAVLQRFVPVVVILAGCYLGLITISLFDPYAALLNDLFAVLIVLLSAYLSARIVHVILHWYFDEFRSRTKAELDEHFIPIFRIAITLFIYLIALILVLSILDQEVSPFLATLGIGGIAVALAVQEPLSNFFAGFYLSIDRPVKVGELIRLESGEEGYIEEIGWRSTRIRSPSNTTIVIPNSRLGQSIVTNYDRPTPLMGFGIPLGVSYASDLDRVERITIEVASQVISRVPGAVRDFQPLVRYSEFGATSIRFSVIMQAETATDRFLLIHEFIKALKKRYDEDGIQIAYMPAWMEYMASGKRP